MPAPIKIAYLLLVHKSPEQVNAFIRQLSDGDVYVHVDAKSAATVSPALARDPNVKVLNGGPVTWGDINQVDATLLLLRAVRASGRRYDYVCLNSGQDLLVRGGLADHLASDKKRIFMTVIKQGKSAQYFWKVRWPKATRNLFESPWHPYRVLRYALWTLFKLGVNLRPNRNTLPEGFDFYRGSSWFTLPPAAMDYILDYLDRNPSYYRTFMEALTPDEAFFQTLLMNSPYAADITGEILTYLNKDNNRAVTLSMKDVADIERSGKFFARKFDAALDAPVVRYFCEKT